MISKNAIRFSDEVADPGSRYGFYSRHTCRLECEEARGFGEAGCFPWYRPAPRPGGAPLCGGTAAYRFEAAAANDSLPPDCSRCLPDCESVEYDHMVNSQVRRSMQGVAPRQGKMAF